MTSPNPTDTAWDDKLLQNPHEVADKRTRVQKMFAAIAPSYDLNNRLHSFWQDQRWRRKAVKLAELKPTDVVVDVACGTGDLTLAFARQLVWVRRAALQPRQVIGIDFTFQMLPIAEAKSDVPYSPPGATNQPPARYSTGVGYANGDALALPLPDACCDVVSIAFGIRNVQDPAAAIREFFRILRPGGRLIILEFSQPTNPLIRWGNDLYCSKIMPYTATWLSRDKSGAYKYLPMSVKTFVTRQQMTDMMTAAGFTTVTQHPMTFGVCVCYRGVKAPANP